MTYKNKGVEYILSNNICIATTNSRTLAEFLDRYARDWGFSDCEFKSNSNIKSNSYKNSKCLKAGHDGAHLQSQH